MAVKKPIKDLLDENEKKVAKNLYKAYRVPTDQLRRCPDILHEIAGGFERLTSRRIEPGILLRYMFNRRKQNDWPRLGRRAEKFVSLLSLLPPDQVAALEQVYEKIGKSVDLYQFRPTLMRQLAQDFHTATGIDEDGEVLAAVMTARRKRGLWPALFSEQQEELRGKTAGGSFSDIGEVHRKYKTGA